MFWQSAVAWKEQLQLCLCPRSSGSEGSRPVCWWHTDGPTHTEWHRLSMGTREILHTWNAICGTGRRMSKIAPVSGYGSLTTDRNPLTPTCVDHWTQLQESADQAWRSTGVPRCCSCVADPWGCFIARSWAHISCIISNSSSQKCDTWRESDQFNIAPWTKDSVCMAGGQCAFSVLWLEALMWILRFVSRKMLEDNCCKHVKTENYIALKTVEIVSHHFRFLGHG